MLKRKKGATGKPQPVVRQQDKGYYDLTFQTQVINSTGSVQLMSVLVQGAGQTQRVGKKVQIKSIQWRGLLQADTTTTFTKGAWILVYDRRPTGSLPAIGDILNSASPFAMNNDDNSGRFQILHRKDFVVIGNTTTPSTGMEAITDDGFIKVNRPTVYKSLGTGAIADIEEGALYFVTIGQTAAGTADAGLSIIFRTRFLDV